MSVFCVWVFITRLLTIMKQLSNVVATFVALNVIRSKVTGHVFYRIRLGRFTEGWVLVNRLEFIT